MIRKIIFLGCILTLSACGTVQKAQYSALESVGIHKRDVLIKRIEDTTKAQEQTKKQFKSAYQQFAELVVVDDKGLEKKYKKLSKAVEQSEESAEKLDGRIDSVEEVAKALFKEWQQELTEYKSAKLRSVSEQNLSQTKQRYGQLIGKMRNAQKNVTPVLQLLQDNTLYLKHNLNARAVNSLQNELVTVEGRVGTLIEEMEASISESQAFIKAMQAN